MKLDKARFHLIAGDGRRFLIDFQLSRNKVTVHCGNDGGELSQEMSTAFVSATEAERLVEWYLLNEPEGGVAEESVAQGILF